jgi:hypothetical protein
MKIKLEHEIKTFEEFEELMFRKLGKEIIKIDGLNYGNVFEKLKKMDVTVISEL